LKHTGSLKWLGAAGIELKMDDQILLVDPYFTRIPLQHTIFGRVSPNRDLVAQLVPCCNFVLVTHCHFDHFMDVPEILLNTQAECIGSPNTCQLLHFFQIPNSQYREVHGGEQHQLGNFRVEVNKSKHIHIPGGLPGNLNADLEPPLQARQYRMDQMFSFRICMGETSIVTDPGLYAAGKPSNILLTTPYLHRQQYEQMLGEIKPATVILTHWDDFFRPLNKSLRPNLCLPRLAIPMRFRVDLIQLKEMILKISPAARVLVPELFKSYPIEELSG
jgi:hypothetical protein